MWPIRAGAQPGDSPFDAHRKTEAQIMAAFDVTMADLAALDPDGSYAAAKAEADQERHEFEHEVLPRRMAAAVKRINDEAHASGLLPPELNFQFGDA